MFNDTFVVMLQLFDEPVQRRKATARHFDSAWLCRIIETILETCSIKTPGKQWRTTNFRQRHSTCMIGTRVVAINMTKHRLDRVPIFEIQNR